jgi:hypothetical protein
MLRKFASVILLTLMSAALLSPVQAQATPPIAVSYNGISFSFDASLGTSVNITDYPADPKTAEYPGGPKPRHITFAIYTQKPFVNAATEQEAIYYNDVVEVYKVADIKGYADFEQRFAEIDKLLATSPDLSGYSVPSGNENGKELPFLPIVPAGQIIRSRIAYVKTGQFSGYAFIAAYRQDVSPFTSKDFDYRYVGLSADKQTLVSVTIQLETPLFPAEIPANLAYDAFSKAFDQYLRESTDKLNQAKPTDFTPALPALENLVKSITVK